MPLGLVLLRTSFFRPLHFPVSANYSCRGKACVKPAIINGVLMWLYFPIIFVLFGIHVYLVRIDKAITGSGRPAYYEKKLQAVLKDSDIQISFPDLLHGPFHLF